MTADVLAALIFALIVYLGWRSGALKQLFRVGAVVAVVAGVPFATPLVRQALFNEAGRATPGIEVWSMVGAGITIYVSVVVVGWMTIGLMRAASTTLSLMDRTGGAAIGALKAALVIYLLAVALLFLEGPLQDSDPDNKLYLRGGWLTSMALEFNVLAPWQFPDLDRFHRALNVATLAAETGQYEVVRDEADAADFLRREEIKELVDDEQLMAWVADEHYPMTLADARVRQVLNDEVLMEQLNDVDWRALRRTLEEDLD